MTYDEFKAQLKVAKVSVKELALLLDMRPNSITNYRAKGEVPRHLEVIATLLATLAAMGIDGRAKLSVASREGGGVPQSTGY